MGWPIANTTVHVLDERMRLVPPGVEGEVYVGGDGLARGYWGGAALTAGRFLPDPFGVGGRLFRTGDRGRRAYDGRLELAARVDERPEIRAGGNAAPASEMERVLAGIWGEVLEMESVGVEDSFFQLGGHSLMAMRVMMLIHETFGVELDLRKLFELQTVRAMAPAVEQAVTESVMAMSDEQALALLARIDAR
jgi:acyl-CoA synthetase (AMP-forming)/AMP-acid ligase II